VSLSPREYIRHILDEIDYILAQISNTDFESFLKDPTLKRAFVRSIEIIGEASKKMPESPKKEQKCSIMKGVSGLAKYRHEFSSVV